MKTKTENTHDESKKTGAVRDCPDSASYLEEMGEHLTKGAIGVIGKYLLIFILLMVALSTARNVFEWGVDNSDASAWERSGLRIYTDHLTGVQYVSDGNSLTVRVHTVAD